MIRTGTFCLSLVYNFITSEFINKTGPVVVNNDEIQRRATKLQIFANTFANYGGLLSKISQILCYSDNSKTNHQVFSECKPFNEDKTRRSFMKYVKDNPDEFATIDEIDYDIYKSGSIGQVHRASFEDGTQIIFKVQYIGLEEQFKTDLYMLEKIASLLMDKVRFADALEEVNIKLHEELDYIREAKNQQIFYDIWKGKTPYIRIPEVYHDLTTETILCMKFVEGESLQHFIENSTQEQRDDIGYKLVEFTFTNLYDYNVFYSDMHYGNFLITDKEIVNVMDFGCTHFIEPRIVDKIKAMHQSIYKQDKQLFWNIITDLDIINDETPIESKEHAFEYFTLQSEPFCTDDVFTFSDEWMARSVYKNVQLMKVWHLPANLVFLCKIPFGLYHVLNKMNVSGNFSKLFESMRK